MENVSLIASYVRGDTKDVVSRHPEMKVLADRPR